jgi:hypothetical protein
MRRLASRQCSNAFSRPGLRHRYAAGEMVPKLSGSESRHSFRRSGRRVRWFPNSQARNHDIRSGDPGGAFKGCSSYADFRELLDKEKDVDAVKITMPVTLCGRHGHRLRTGMAKSFRVRQLKPDDPPQLIRLGLMCSHRNGFIPAEAIGALGKSDSESTIPLLMIRLVDWVEAARLDADIE